LRTVLFLCTGNYFRSRFAELLFNRLADDAGLDVRAVSAGLAHQCHTRNPGPISPHTLAGLRARGIDVGSALRGPCDVTEADLGAATVVIAVKETEHRPMVGERFPAWAERIRYWDVDDVPEVPAADALARLEVLVRALVTELG
jgi:protein-tyrosine phosphatase